MKIIHTTAPVDADILHNPVEKDGVMVEGQLETVFEVFDGDDSIRLRQWFDHDLFVGVELYVEEENYWPLSQEQAAALWPVIKHFAETGGLPKAAEVS